MARTWLASGLRVLLGLIYVFGSVNGLLYIAGLGMVAEVPIHPFTQSLIDTGYLLTFVKLVELVGALLLLSGQYVPLALAILAPITANIVAFHLFLDPSVLLMSVVMLALHLALAYLYRRSFAGLFERAPQLADAANSPPTAARRREQTP